jgi:predicted dehydrogenase
MSGARHPRRVVVVGAGLVARFWLPPLLARPGVEIVAVVDPDTRRAADAVAAAGARSPVFGELAEALGATRPDLAAILTPPALHRRVAEELLDAGCDVLCEKPLALTMDDARAIVAAAQSAGRHLAVMQNRRFQPGVQRMREGIAGDAIGWPVQLCADMFMRPPHVPAHLDAEPHPLLLEMAVHTFDQARFLAGADAEWAFCHELRPPGSDFAGAAAAVCTFGLEGGASFSYRGSWSADGFPTPWDAAWRIVGPSGTVRWDGTGAPACSVRGEGPPVEWPVAPPRDATGHATALDVLLDALDDDRPAPTDGADNLRTLAMVLASIRSSRERRPVTIAEVLGD